MPMVFNNNELSGKILSTLGLLQTLEIFLLRSHLRQVHNEFHENVLQVGISVVGRNYYGVFPLRGTLLNVREASHKQIMENAEMTSIKQILGLQHGKQYDSVKTLRYGHLMIMTDQLKIFEGLAFPPLYFYNGGVREFLATIKQHVFIARKIVQNVLHARESGKGVLTAPFRLLRSNRLGVILTFAVYKTDLPSNATSSERIQATDGSYNMLAHLTLVIHSENMRCIQTKTTMPMWDVLAKVEDDYHEMMELQKRAEAADVAKSQFLATVSHEIKTPMNGVLGMLQMLMDADLDVTQQDYVRNCTGQWKSIGLTNK
ncbi:unnamed protein product [Camellia sinensis]